jgi:hypothetical protein
VFLFGGEGGLHVVLVRGTARLSVRVIGGVLSDGVVTS